jgi:hypothetical protein
VHEATDEVSKQSSEPVSKVGTNYVRPTITGASAGARTSKFENIAAQKAEEAEQAR